MTDALREYLISEIRRWRDRSGPPTLADVRAVGVDRTAIRAYLRGAGWYCEAGDRDNYARRLDTWEWYRSDGATVSLRYDDHAIAEIARAEDRSPWEVLDDIAWGLGWRTIYDADGQPIARARGIYVEPWPED